MGSEQGQIELSAALHDLRGLIRLAVVFSIFVNLLMLTSPLFMLQVYDRVLGSQSEETLAALVLLMSLLFALMAVLDFARAQLMARVAARMQLRLEARVFSAALSRAAQQRTADVLAPTLATGPQRTGSTMGGAQFGTAAGQAPFDTAEALRGFAPTEAQNIAAERRGAAANGQSASVAELDAIARFLASPGFLALVDLPWLPVFLAATALFHPALGLLACGGGAVLVAITLLNQRGTKAGLAQISRETRAAENLSDRLFAEAEQVQALGMQASAETRWRLHRGFQSEATLRTADQTALWTTLGRSFRLYLQSAVLALAALLVLRHEVSAGAMIAASILTGRALAPVDQLLAHWPLLVRARQGRKALAALLGQTPPAPQRLPLPKPAPHLRLSGLSVTLAGEAKPSLQGLDAEILPGQALAVIGASGSGKTTLARCLTGTLPLSPKMALLGGAPLAAYGEDLGRYIGYLPQRVQLFDGTIAENIARMALSRDPAKIIAAADRAGLHQTILALPEGYETLIFARAPQLSGGQIQRLALARALYDDPVLVVLDEPDSNLDHDGSEALSRAVRRLKAEGKIVIIMAHRPATIRDCDLVLLLEAGQSRAFGPARDLLRAMMRQSNAAAKAPAPEVYAAAEGVGA